MASDEPVQGAAALMDTLQGFCNESTLTRVEILECLEAVKWAMLRSWNAENE